MAERFGVGGAGNCGRSLQQVPKEDIASSQKDRQVRQVRVTTTTTPPAADTTTTPDAAAAAASTTTTDVQVRLLQRCQLGHTQGDVATRRTRPGLSPGLHGAVLRQLVPGQTLDRPRILDRLPLPQVRLRSLRRMLLLL